MKGYGRAKRDIGERKGGRERQRDGDRDRQTDKHIYTETEI